MTQDRQLYRVTWPVVQVRLATPIEHAGRRVNAMHVDRGGLLPDNVDPVQLQHLLAIGMVEPVPQAAAAEVA